MVDTADMICTVDMVYTVDIEQWQVWPHMRHLQMFQKVEYGGGPIFKVVLEC